MYNGVVANVKGTEVHIRCNDLKEIVGCLYPKGTFEQNDLVTVEKVLDVPDETRDLYDESCRAYGIDPEEKDSWTYLSIGEIRIIDRHDRPMVPYDDLILSILNDETPIMKNDVEIEIPNNVRVDNFYTYRKDKSRTFSVTKLSDMGDRKYVFIKPRSYSGKEFPILVDTLIKNYEPLVE